MNTRLKIMLLAVAVVIALVAIMAYIGVYIIKPVNYSSSNYYGYGMMFGSSFGYWYILMPVMAAVAIIVLFLFLFLIGAFAEKAGEVTRYSAVDILKQKLARGEISEEEYERKIKLIG